MIATDVPTSWLIGMAIVALFVLAVLGGFAWLDRQRARRIPDPLENRKRIGL